MFRQQRNKQIEQNLDDDDDDDAAGAAAGAVADGNKRLDNCDEDDDDTIKESRVLFNLSMVCLLSLREVFVDRCFRAIKSVMDTTHTTFRQ